MLYKCNHCNYFSNRLSNLRRHEKKKNPCYKETEVSVCKTEDKNIQENVCQNIGVVCQNIGGVCQNIGGDCQNIKDVCQNIGGDCQNVGGNCQNVGKTDEPKQIFKCDKCSKILSSKRRLTEHISKCSGLHPLQCAICLKMFASAQGKYEHKKYVKCNPPLITSSSTINNTTTNSINNNTNNIDNSINKTINNTINLNFRGNFDTVSKDDIQQIISQLEKSEYIKMIQDNMKTGKYAVPRTLEHIYFNDNFPKMQTLKKERRNDKMVEVHVNGKWEKRLVDDILKELIGKVEDYHSYYFKHLEDKYKNVPIGSAQWNKLTRPVKIFGHLMLWYNGFTGKDIENIGIELNSPDNDKEKKARNKDMAKILKEKVYEQTCNKKEEDYLQLI